MDRRIVSKIISFYINKFRYICRRFLISCGNSSSIFVPQSDFRIICSPKIRASGSTFTQFNCRDARSGSSLGFLIGCTKEQVNVSRRKRCAVTLLAPYYFYPMKFPALKIRQNRGPRREVSIEVWQRLYWQEESAKFAAVAQRSRSICVRHFAAKLFEATSHFLSFRRWFCETYTILRNEAWPRYENDDRDFTSVFI